MRLKFTIGTVFIGLSSAFILIISCDKVTNESKRIANFNVSMNLPDQSFILDSAMFKSEETVSFEKVLTQFVININLDSIIKAHNIFAADIESGKFIIFFLTIVNPMAGMNLNFVSDLRVAISENAGFSPELDVAMTNTIPADSKSITFSLSDTDITNYLAKQHFYIRLYGNKTAQMPVISIPFIFQSGVTFTVNPL